MKEILLMYARHAKQTNASALALVDGLSNEAREEDRKSYYKSLSGLVRHVFDSTIYFHDLFRASFPAAAKALAATAGLTAPEGKLSEAQWKALKTALELADQAFVNLVQSLSEDDFVHPIELDWYDGKPSAVPFFFIAAQLFEHGTHHRGQISQILDELGVEHDFSGIAVDLLPRT
jgi:uncharacterized damage-inducible protein DinB